MAGENQASMALRGAAPQEPEPSQLVPGRNCGTCSLCCKVLAVPELNKPAGQWCIHAVPGSGCSYHAERPQGCRRFFCSWRLDPKLGPEWKPEVSRFVLSADPDRRALVVMVDPGMPLAWKREPYYARLKQLSEASFRQGQKVLVNLRGNITVLLPDREVPIGVVDPAAEIVVWREGSAYGAKLRRYSEPAETPPPRRAESSGRPAGNSSSVEDPGFLELVFKEGFEKTCKLLDDTSIDDVDALARSIRGRNKVLDETAGTYAEAAGAECRAGCVSCCYLMVSGPPFEIFAIARHLLDTRTPPELERLRERLREVAEVPLDPTLRARARMPCALLEDGRCTTYELRPSVCRMALSQSRAACEACLKDAGGFIPYIEQPSKFAAVMQMGIDYALITRRDLSTEGAELTRALLIALDDYEGAFRTWLQGKDPFPGTHVGAPGGPSSRDKAIAAAKRLGIA